MAVILGIALAFKPMWGLAAGAVLLIQRRWAAAAGLLAGALIVTGLSMMPWSGEIWLDDWWIRVAELRLKFNSPSLLDLYAPLFFLIVFIWLAGALALLQRHHDRHPDIWLWACVLLLTWPRISAYSYLILLPVIYYFWNQWGWRKALLLATPTTEPVHWVFSALDAAHAYHYLLYLWVVVVAGILYVALWRFDDKSESPSASQTPNPHLDQRA